MNNVSFKDVYIAIRDVQKEATKLKEIIEALLPLCTRRELALGYLAACMLLVEQQLTEWGIK